MTLSTLKAPMFVTGRYNTDKRDLIWIAVRWRDGNLDMISNAYTTFDRCADYCDSMNKGETVMKWKPFATNLIKNV
jgi:hypothetical protein